MLRPVKSIGASSFWLMKRDTANIAAITTTNGAMVTKMYGTETAWYLQTNHASCRMPMSCLSAATMYWSISMSSSMTITMKTRNTNAAR